MAGDHTASISKQRRTPQLGSEKESMQGGIVSSYNRGGRAANHSFTRRLLEGYIVPNEDIQSNNSPLSSGGASLSFSALRNVMRCSVLFGPIVGMWQKTPSLEMAAHMVILSPL